MAWKTKPTRFNLKLVRSVRKALANGESCGLEVTLCHLLAAIKEDGQEIYSFWLVRDDEGTCMAICREMPEVLVFEESEGKAIAAANVAIKDAFAARGYRSDKASAVTVGPDRRRHTATIVLGQRRNRQMPLDRLHVVRHGAGKLLCPRRQ